MWFFVTKQVRISARTWRKMSNGARWIVIALCVGVMYEAIAGMIQAIATFF